MYGQRENVLGREQQPDCPAAQPSSLEALAWRHAKLARVPPVGPKDRPVGPRDPADRGSRRRARRRAAEDQRGSCRGDGLRVAASAGCLNALPDPRSRPGCRRLDGGAVTTSNNAGVIVVGSSPWARVPCNADIEARVPWRGCQGSGTKTLTAEDGPWPSSPAPATPVVGDRAAVAAAGRSSQCNRPTIDETGSDKPAESGSRASAAVGLGPAPRVALTVRGALVAAGRAHDSSRPHAARGRDRARNRWAVCTPPAGCALREWTDERRARRCRWTTGATVVGAGDFSGARAPGGISRPRPGRCRRSRVSMATSTEWRRTIERV